MGGRPKAPVALNETERKQLETWARSRNTSQALALRSRIVLACAQGLDNKDVAEQLATSQQTVSKWRNRFLHRRLDGLLDAPRTGAPRIIDDARVEALLERTLASAPPNAAQWSTRSMANEMGISPSAVSRIWRSFGMQSRGPETFAPLTDKSFTCGTLDILGLYVGPPLRAMAVVCTNAGPPSSAPMQEAPSAAALDRMANDYIRQGATMLLTALDIATGHVLGQSHLRQRGGDFLRFVHTIDGAVGPALGMHLVICESGGQTPPTVRSWLARQTRFQVHVAPSAAAWLMQAERWFAALTERQIRQGILHPTRRLEQAVRHYLDLQHTEPRPFVWIKSFDGSPAAVERSGS